MIAEQVSDQLVAGRESDRRGYQLNGGRTVVRWPQRVRCRLDNDGFGIAQELSETGRHILTRKSGQGLCRDSTRGGTRIGQGADETVVCGRVAAVSQ